MDDWVLYTSSRIAQGKESQRRVRHMSALRSTIYWKCSTVLGTWLRVQLTGAVTTIYVHLNLSSLVWCSHWRLHQNRRQKTTYYSEFTIYLLYLHQYYWKSHILKDLFEIFLRDSLELPSLEGMHYRCKLLHIDILQHIIIVLFVRSLLLPWV